MNKVLKDTVIKIKKIDYFRDLGGLYTADGRKIKKGLLYRSSHLSNISYKTQKMLEEKYDNTPVYGYIPRDKTRFCDKDLFGDDLWKYVILRKIILWYGRKDFPCRHKSAGLCNCIS